MVTVSIALEEEKLRKVLMLKEQNPELNMSQLLGLLIQRGLAYTAKLELESTNTQRVEYVHKV